MSSNDYIAYLTKRFVNYLDTPKEERQKRRLEKRQVSWARRLFGDIPFSLHMFWRKHWTRLRKASSSHRE